MGSEPGLFFQVLNLKRDETSGRVVIDSYTPVSAAMPFKYRGLGGVDLAVGDLEGDGENEIVVVRTGTKTYGDGIRIRVYRAICDENGQACDLVPKSLPVVLRNSKEGNPSDQVDIALGNFDHDKGDEILLGMQAIITLDTETGIVSVSREPHRQILAFKCAF